ncbi:MAG: DUF2281 domain-containing protein [Nitrospirota bacterium]|nr:DUF2281 domain-containing protein [Nitrospirota bacterium]
MAKQKTIDLGELPGDIQREAVDYIEFLMKKYGKREKKGAFRFDWEGGLSELKNKFTSVELQHKAAEWR